MFYRGVLAIATKDLPKLNLSTNSGRIAMAKAVSQVEVTVIKINYHNNKDICIFNIFKYKLL